MPKSNSQQKSTPDACIHHQQVGAEWRGAGGIASGPVSTDGTWGELTRDSNLNCGIAREREKINRPEHIVGPFAEQRNN